MQPPPQPTPAPPPQPAPEPAPGALPAAPTRSATVVLPEGTLRIPRTADEIEGLRVRRNMLRDQLSRAQGRREELVQQLNRGLPDEAKPGLQERLKVADERIMQIERDISVTDQLMANADYKALAESQQRERENQGPMVEEEVAVVTGFAAFGGGIVLAMLVGRVRRRFARRRAAKLGGTPAAVAGAQADDPRIERLAQAVDAIALEVERIGEGQRFVTQLLSARPTGAALGAESERR